MTILVCLGPRPDTWWQAKNEIGRRVLDRAEELSGDAETRQAIFDGKIAQSLDLNRIDPLLRERVWYAVEAAAKQIAAEPPIDDTDWLPDWTEHVRDLAGEMQTRRDSPDRPGPWPNVTQA